ncbi:MAG TPA: hemerythrin domain-containing protein [Candidatus Baltobacteraceae bacterium]|jgi:hemerythrin superfamily protein|nr:hemerythrin domain-containing protein [Candidatus Baltobacteraceae bacterium]
MDALRVLKGQHKEVDALFKELEELGDGAKASRKKLFTEIDAKLTVHSKIEETIFYPALKDAAARDKEAKQEVLEAYEEHANVKAMLRKLEDAEPSDETYNAKLQVLHELVKHHVKEEEHTMFPEAKTLMSEDELEALGEELQAATESLQQGKDARSSRGTIAASKDSAKVR